VRYVKGQLFAAPDGGLLRVINPDWPRGGEPFCERVDYGEVLTGTRQGVALESEDDQRATEVREMAREADGVRPLLVGRVMGEAIPIAARPSVGDELTVSCQVTGVHEERDENGRLRVFVDLDPQGAVG
jgi:hypothetical protein